MQYIRDIRGENLNVIILYERDNEEYLPGIASR